MTERIGLAISDEFLRWHWQRDAGGRLHIVRDDDNGAQIPMDSSRDFSLFKVSDLQHFGRLRREATARAAVAAMREPTEAMRDAGEVGTHWDEWAHSDCKVKATDVFQAMIDEILKESTDAA